MGDLGGTILESMAMGIPVVCSPIAARGIDAVPGEHLLVASDATEEAEAIQRLLDDPAERRRLAESGRARVLSHHDWVRSLRQLDRLIDECLAGAAPHLTGSARDCRVPPRPRLQAWTERFSSALR